MGTRDLAAWLAWQERLHPVEIDLGLERVRCVLEAIGLARPPFRVVTVGGTNGKGSCVATLEALSLEAGLVTGAYTSPHLVRYNERVRVNGADVTDAELVAAFEAVEAHRGTTSLSYFEFGTLAALEIFRRRGVELAVLEVGLGGRLDAVNVLDPEVAVVTSVGLDHMEWLGPDRESIGREKGGIFRAGRPAIVGDRDPPASLLAAAGDTVLRLGRDFDWRSEGPGDAWRWQGAGVDLPGLPRGPLAAPALLDNAACALAAFNLLQPLANSPGLPARALERMRLVGRLQRIPGDVEWWLDVAHNPDGAAVLAGALRASPVAGRTFVVIGMLADKDAAAVGAALDGAADHWIAATLLPPRGLDAAALASRLGVRAPVECAPSVAEACARARARARPGDRVVVCGSFHAVGPALEWLGVYCEPLNL